jgi:predicted ATPase/class 3 adenylate cyclase
MVQRPSGVVTFLFSDIEGSTPMWESDEAAMVLRLRRHDEIVRKTVTSRGGYVFSTAGDSFGVAFRSPLDAVSSAVALQRQFIDMNLSVRMGLHVGEAHERDGDYFGPTVNRAARLMHIANGRQIVASSAVAALVDGSVAVRDLGLHELRGMTTPARVWQLGARDLPDAFPPLRTTTTARTNMAADSESLIGRDRELAELIELAGTARCVTVTGVGGIGKTALVESAAICLLDRFPDGVWMASLGAVDRCEAVADVVLEAIGGRRHGEQSVLSVVRDLASARSFLLVLDNCEHVLAAAVECVLAVTSGRDCAVMATSREPLGVAGERLLPLGSLTPPSAAELFLERARAMDPAFVVDERSQDAVDEICRRLDGVPLALELAAGRARSMTPREIANHLDARFRLLRGGGRGGVERHRTLQAAVKWSYDLLDDRGQAVVRQLSTFAGSFTLEAVRAVCTDLDDVVDAIDVVDHLVISSMLNADRSGLTTRYSMLETIRHFGEEMLGAAGEAERLRRRHAAYYLEVAERARAQMSSSDAGAAAETFAREWDNLRATHDWAMAIGDVDAALRLAIACGWYGALGERFEVLSWLEEVIDTPQARRSERWPVAAGIAALLLWITGRLDQAIELGERAHQVATDTGHAAPEPLIALIFIEWSAGRPGETERHFLELTALLDDDADPLHVGLAHHVKAVFLLVAGSPEVTSHGQAAVEAAMSVKNPHQLALAHLSRLIATAATQHRDLAREAFDDTMRWADHAHNRMVAGLAPLFLVMAIGDDDPLECLRITANVLQTHLRTGFQVNVDFAVRRLLIPLCKLERFETVATLLGGLSGIPQATPDTQGTLGRAEELARDALGASFDNARVRGQRMTTVELVRAALEEVEPLLHHTDSPAATELQPP